MQATGMPVSKVLVSVARIMLPAGLLLALTYLLPPFDLSGKLGLIAYWVAESGGTRGLPLIGIALTALVVCRQGLHWRQRVGESLVIVAVLATFLGAGAFVNEHWIKTQFKIPRPNIVSMAETMALKTSAATFYELPNKAERSEHLKEMVLTPDFCLTSGLQECVRDHWISETGYSFPSGHAFSSMMVATFFLAVGLSWFSRRTRWGFYLLVPWAVAVCLSRPILRVHTTTDICAGAFQGVVVGTLAFLVVRWIFFRFWTRPRFLVALNGPKATDVPNIAKARSEERLL